MPFTLKLLGARPVRLRVEEGKVFVIGRSSDADLCLEDKLISRRHCELELREGNQLEVRDLGSRNGTCLNGEKIVGKAVARPGDQIKVGSSFILVEGNQESSDSRPVAVPGAPSAAGVESKVMSRPRGQGPTEGGGQRRHVSESIVPSGPLPSLPGYEFLKEIGRGKTGRIFKACQLVDRKDVAVKILDVARAGNENAVKRFYREARALQRLDHPNIVRIHEVDKAGAMHYYSMEFVEGVSLAKKLRDGPIGAREALSIAIQVARALELAHALHVIHRDVSPENILITPAGIAKLFDFGFVKSGDEGSLTNLGEIVGDLLYSSPEQIRDPRDVDARTDLYALGSTLFHALAGRPPFEGTNYLETLRKVLAMPAPRVKDLVPEVPAKVDEVVAKLLEKDREHRYQTAGEVIRALEDALLDACSPGPPAADKGTFGGGFSGMELVEIVQFLEFTQKDGTLVVSAPPLEGEMRFKGGEIVGASAGHFEGEEAVILLLNAPGGTFRFRALASGERILEAGLQIKPSVVALSAMRSRDERTKARS